MRDYIELGPTPAEESCEQVPYEDVQKARLECRAFIAEIEAALGEPPLGAELRVKSNAHDFGSYFEVVCYFDEDFEDSVDYAFRCEAETPQRWTEIGRAILEGNQ